MKTIMGNILKRFESSNSDHTGPRELKGYYRIFFNIVAALFCSFFLYTAIFGMISGELHRGLFVLGCFMLTFLYFPARRKSLAKPTVLDILLVFLSVAVIWYWIHQHATLQMRIGMPPLPMDVGMGIIMIILSLEAARRTTGYAIPILAIFFLFYAHQGPLFPGLLRHRGFTISRIVEFAYLTTEGMLGMISDVFATFVFVFIVFGSFLNSSGIGHFFIDLAKALTGNKTGGPALTAVFGSAIFGSISGSPNANVAATGVFTIPLMKKVGYKPHFAAAVEAAASTGGAYSPPIMGAAAFIIAELTQTPYLHIMKISILPAFLYFLSVGVFVYIQAKRDGLHGLPKEELPCLKAVAKKFYLVIPIFVMVCLLVIGYSPFFSASIATLSSVATSWISKETRMGITAIYEALVKGAKDVLMIGSLVGALGIILGMSILTALPHRFAGVLLEASGGSLFVAVILVIIAGYVIGMGLNITPAYILVSMFCVPALTQLGVPTLNAHMIAFWASVGSVVTPPVALASFAAAAIAKANFLKTSLVATVLASWLFLMPFLFVYTQILDIFNLSIGLVMRIIFSCVMSVCAWVFATQGFIIRKVHWVMRIVLAATAIMLLRTDLVTEILGTIIVLGYFAYQKTTTPKATHQGGVIAGSES